MLARKVPQRLIYSREGTHKHIAPAKKRGAVDMLPMMFNSQRVFAEEVVAQLLYRRHAAFGFAFQCGLAPTRQPVIGGNFHEAHSGAWKKLLNLHYLHNACLLSMQKGGRNAEEASTAYRHTGKQ
jgi:hypothetical protein